MQFVLWWLSPTGTRITDILNHRTTKELWDRPIKYMLQIMHSISKEKSLKSQVGISNRQLSRLNEKHANYKSHNKYLPKYIFFLSPLGWGWVEDEFFKKKNAVQTSETCLKFTCLRRMNLFQFHGLFRKKNRVTFIRRHERQRNERIFVWNTVIVTS